MNIKNREKRPIVKNDGKTGLKTLYFDVQPTQSRKTFVKLHKKKLSFL